MANQSPTPSPEGILDFGFQILDYLESMARNACPDEIYLFSPACALPFLTLALYSLSISLPIQNPKRFLCLLTPNAFHLMTLVRIH